MRDQPILLFAAKPRVLMICAHEPTVDPRIRWEAEFAAKQFEVTVLGFKEKVAPLLIMRTSASTKSLGWNVLTSTQLTTSGG